MKNLTVADVLKLDIFKNVSIRAGASGLSSAVSGITTAEDPDLIQWLSGGEILLTTLYGVSTEGLSFSAYIEQLAQKKISALIVKPGPRVREIPEEIIKIGNEYSIPLIELSPDTRYIQVVSSVMQLLLDNKARYYLEIQNALSHMVASGAQEQEILDYLSNYVPAAIYLCDSEKNILYCSQSDEFRADVAVADRITLPILCMGEVNGYLEAVLNHYLDENLEGVLKNAANLIGVFFLKKYYVTKIEQKYISSFLNDLFGGFLDEKQIEEKAASYGWKQDDTYLTAVIQLESDRGGGRIQEVFMEIAPLVPKSGYYFCILEHRFHLLYHMDGLQNPEVMLIHMGETIQKLKDYIGKMYGFYTFYSGISTAASSIQSLPSKIQEADDALQFGQLFHNNVVKYSELGVLRMLASYSRRDNLTEMIPPAVKKLAEYDKENNTQYLETLDSLLGNNLNLSKTAKELFIHYKTMLHRMDRICEIAEVSLDDRQQRLDIELGVKLYMMLPK
ncbi:PucR family transcriptional regulator [Clostridium sp. AM58-1XD]|uniref:PucR family transcriptional regulator n=1 Tax=Clostridium sp. AM58-1XD TaxID=2292307 RepID=UPI000E53A27C|nr:PucR family transcriptional regulator [Clostridium sp. AM58-1XD]RGZ00416.1 PucR family transcriptional regulator [Clostridium sp. AM58-1XD]